MNDKDKEAFEKWYKINFSELVKENGIGKIQNDFIKAWQAACEYKQKEIDELEESLATRLAKSYIAGKDLSKIIQKNLTNEVKKLQAENEKLKKSLNFTIKAAEYLFKPDEKLADGLFPTSYFTLSYEGDLELIEKTKLARQVLKELEEK